MTYEGVILSPCLSLLSQSSKGYSRHLVPIPTCVRKPRARVWYVYDTTVTNKEKLTTTKGHIYIYGTVLPYRVCVALACPSV